MGELNNNQKVSQVAETRTHPDRKSRRRQCHLFLLCCAFLMTATNMSAEKGY